MDDNMSKYDYFWERFNDLSDEPVKQTSALKSMIVASECPYLAEKIMPVGEPTRSNEVKE